MTASLLKAHVGGLMRNRQGGRKMEGNEIPLYTRQRLMRSGGGGMLLVLWIAHRGYSAKTDKSTSISWGSGLILEICRVGFI